MLIYTAKPKLEFGNILVSIPNQLLKPRITIGIDDDRIRYANNRLLLVENNAVSYDFNAEDNAWGTNFCSVSPTGLYDRRHHFFRRTSQIFKCKRCPTQT